MMPLETSDTTRAIGQTRQWVDAVVIGCNFCPFAARVVKQNSIHYTAESSTVLSVCLEAFVQETTRLDADGTIDTSFLIFTAAFPDFDSYLNMLSLAEKLLHLNGYEGVYQLAGFHPLYRFAKTAEDDAANYTNRSVYPMLHLLREGGIDLALAQYKNPGAIPGRNIAYAREKGLAYMQALRNGCL